jgi:hypothetical protein
MIEPVTLATITSAVTVLASECGKGIASDAGKLVWNKIKQLFGWKADPAPSELAPAIAQKLQQEETLAEQIVRLLKQGDGDDIVPQLVGRITAKKSIVAGEMTVQGDFNM